MVDTLDREQMTREMHARSLEHATWIALFNAQSLNACDVDTRALQDQLTTMLGAISNLRRRLEDAVCAPDWIR